MDQQHFTTHQHKKGHHLAYDERVQIQLRLRDGWPPNQIAAEIGCAPNTVRNEIRRGTVDLYNGHVQRYKAEAGQKAYDGHRKNSCRHYEYLSKKRFMKYVSEHFHKCGWSLDACRGRALIDDGFSETEVVSTRTLYNYVNAGLLDIRNMDLPGKHRRSPHTA